LIDRYGVKAVLRRDYLGYGEILQINAAERILRLHREMQTFSDWSAWSRQNKDGAAYLLCAMKAASEAGLLDG